MDKPVPIGRRTALTLISSAILAPAAARAAVKESDYYGVWSGTLDVGAAKLRLKLHIAAEGAALVSVDQGGANIPASKVTLTPEKVRLEFSVIQATFEGKLSGDTLSGTFTQGQAFPLTFTRGDAFKPVYTTAPITPEQHQSLLKASGAPALAIGWQGPTGSDVRALGLRVADRSEAATAQDKWHIGSITKSMTATLVARLAEQGVLNWDMTVGDVLGDIEGLNAAYEPVTFRHLMSHHSGLPGNIPQMALIGFTMNDADLPDAREERRRYAAIALGMTPEAKPGEKMIYANNGYIVAGAMMEKLTGKSWESLIQTHLFAPLGITSAGFGTPTKVAGDQPCGHVFIPGQGLKPVLPGGQWPTDNPVALGPAGRVHIALSDMLLYLKAHRDRPEAFLKAESWKTLHTPPFTDTYAMGWVVGKSGGLWHNGSNTTWYAEAGIDGQRRTVAVAAANYADLSKTAPVVSAALKGAMLSAGAPA